MVRISGVDLPMNKRIEVALSYIHGIGRPTAKKILNELGISPDTRVKDLSYDESNKIRNKIDAEYMVEGDLRRKVALDIKRLMEIGCLRGIRHKKNLPVRGQRTRTNAKTARGGRSRTPIAAKAKKKK